MWRLRQAEKVSSSESTARRSLAGNRDLAAGSVHVHRWLRGFVDVARSQRRRWSNGSSISRQTEPSNPSALVGSWNMRHSVVSSNGRRVYRPIEATRAALAKRASAPLLVVTTRMSGKLG